MQLPCHQSDELMTRRMDGFKFGGLMNGLRRDELMKRF
jgi:hypothetical protein